MPGKKLNPLVEHIIESVHQMRDNGSTSLYIYVHRTRLREVVRHARILSEIIDDSRIGVAAFVGTNFLGTDEVRISTEPILWREPEQT